MIRSLALVAASAASSVAQTFVVDIANGPGSHFATIDAAVTAVPDGAVIVVRAGDYDSFTISGKGLTIVGEPGARVTWFSVANTAAAQAVTIRDLPFRLAFASAQLASCQGAVLLQRLSVPFTGFATLVVQQCPQLVVDHCGPFLSPGGVPMQFLQSNAVCIASHARATDAPAVRVSGGSLQLVDCALTAASIQPSIGTLDVGPGAQVRFAGGSVSAFAPFGGAAISGSGTLRIDPAVVVTGPVTGVTVLAVPLAAVVGTGGPIGTAATATMRAPAGHLGVLLLGVAAAPAALPGIVDDVWLAAGAVPMAAGVFGASLAGAVVVPADPLLLGSRFGWQGVTLDPAGALATTNPSLFAP